MPDRASKVTWLGSAGYAALGSFATLAGAIVTAMLVGLVRAKLAPATPSTPILQHVQAFHAVLDSTVVIVVLLAQVIIAVLLALPLQATALALRRRGADGMVFAKVAGLTLLSSLISFAALYPALSAGKQMMLEDADSQALFLAGALALLYGLHTIGLAFGRLFARI